MLCCALMAAPPHGPQHRRTPPPHVGKQQDVQTGAAAEPERLNDLFSPIVRSSSPPPPPKKNVCFPAALGRNAIRAPSAVVQRGGHRLGQAGIGRCAHLGHLAAGWGGSWQPPALPRANKQTETRHSQHGEGGRGVGELKSCLLGSLGGKAAGGKQSKANWLGG